MGSACYKGPSSRQSRQKPRANPIIHLRSLTKQYAPQNRVPKLTLPGNAYSSDGCQGKEIAINWFALANASHQTAVTRRR